MVGIISNTECCLPLLQILAQNKVPVSVFTDAGSLWQEGAGIIAQFCGQARIPCQSAEAGSLYFWMEQAKIDMAFFMGFAHLIDTTLLPVKLRSKVYNIHFGPLPAYRGPSPVFWQLKNGESQLTATIHHVADKFDTGALVWSKSVKREAHISFGLANMVLGQVVVEGVGQVINGLLQNKPLPQLPQQGKAGYYKRPELKDVTINWHTMDAAQICNLILACNPWNKGAITYINSKDIKIIDGTATNMAHNAQPGTVIYNDNKLYIACINNKAVEIIMLVIDGTFVPARDAQIWGIQSGQLLI
ncbi:MAG: formyltransferase family protein [Mucilaginibacter sp.]